MVLMSELLRIEMILQIGQRTLENPVVCRSSVAKMRRWLAAGQHSAQVRTKLEQLLGRFGNARFAPNLASP